MHSDDLKERIADLLDGVSKIEERMRCADNPQLTQLDKDELELIRTKAMLLNSIALNELNWSFYYTKEELKKLNTTLEGIRGSIRRML